MLSFYFKDRALYIALFFVTVFTFVFVLFLYRVSAEALLYCCLLCAAAALLFICADLWRFVRFYKTLEHLKSGIACSLDGLAALGDFPGRELIETLYETNRETLSSTEARVFDMRDYFTLWAHQIKTPIAALRLLLQREDIPNREELEIELFKIEQYVEMVLGYLRFGNGGSDYIIRRCDLDSAARQSVRKYAKLFIARRISLDYRAEPLTVLSDEKWLCFVLEQILSNSLKYTENGSISIYTEENALIISDSGIGIRPEDLPRVFENGFTGLNGHEDKKATGIGLYLCRCILAALGHEISIRSELGKGTSVRIFFPPSEQVRE